MIYRFEHVYTQMQIFLYQSTMLTLQIYYITGDMYLYSFGDDTYTYYKLDGYIDVNMIIRD